MEERKVLKNGNVLLKELESETESLLGNELEEGDVVLVIKGIFTSNSPIMGGKVAESYVEADKIENLVKILKEEREPEGSLVTEQLEHNPVQNVCSLCEETSENKTFKVRKNGMEKFTVHGECLEKLSNKIEEGMDENMDMIMAGTI